MSDRKSGISGTLHSPAYARDLAYIHDVGFGAFANQAAPGLRVILRDMGVHEGLVVDLGCGSGIWARHLTDAGYHVLGVDQSPAMIELATNRAPDASFQIESFLDFELPRCRAITALGEVLCYQFDSANNRKALARLFKNAFAALEPGGVMIFDVAEVGLDRDRVPTFREGKDWTALLRFEYDAKRDQLIRHITTFRKVGDLYRRHDEVHRLQLYRRNEIVQMLRAAGFRTRSVRQYGEFPLLPGRIAFIARKPF
jgi:SAM-dependent methyltransferase